MVLRFAAICIVLTVSSPAWAVDAVATPPAGSAASPAPASQGGVKAAEFVKVYAQWKETLGKLSSLKVEYASTAEAGKKAAIAKEFKSLFPTTPALLDKLLEAAKAAYAEAPNTDPALTDLLVGTLSDCTCRESQNHRKVGSDDYERAFSIGKLLMDKNCKDASVPSLAGIAAFCVNEYDLAEKYFKQAQAAGHMDPVAALDFQQIPFYKQAWATEEQIRNAEAKADDLPRVHLKTTAGDIDIELFENEAPNTVLNFITLVDKKFYDGLTFHRVLPGFMAQGGDPQGDGKGGPGYTIPCECFVPNHRIHFRGSMSMAHTAQKDTGGSQFFLTFVPTHHLDGLHTVFGRVISGFDVLAKIKRRDPDEETVGEADKIIEAKVTRRRKHSYDEKDLKKSS